MTDYEVVQKIMASKRPGVAEERKLYFIKAFLSHWTTVEDVDWIWDEMECYK